MSSSAEPEAGQDDGERVIDRSGDIDQRPLEERTGKELANPIVFPPAARFSAQPQHAVQRYQAAPLPPAAPSGELASIARRLQADLDTQYARAKSQLEQLSQKIEAQEKRCLPPKLDGDLQQIRFQRQKILIANGPMLASCLREEKSRLADLESFKAENRLTREPHYPSSPVLAFGILSVLILLEAGINGVLFADSSDQGLFGGWLEALVLSVTNVGAAFLFGRIVLPQLHRRNVLLKAGAFALCLLGVAALAGVNLTGAHYRDFRAAASPGTPDAAAPRREAPLSPAALKPASANAAAHKPGKPQALEPPQPPLAPAHGAEAERAKEREAIRKLLEAPFTFDSFMSLFLFVIGICGAAIAAADGYKLDDPYPGFGKRHRKYIAAHAQSTGALHRILSQSNAIMTGSFQAIARKIEGFAQEMSALLALHHAYAGGYKAFQDALEEAASDAETQIAAHSRLINKVPDRSFPDLYAIGVKQLPQLNGKQVKFYETQDKKLKALQKSAAKEQSDTLGVFEAASADFQKLLADASRASLQAALGSLREDQGAEPA